MLLTILASTVIASASPQSEVDTRVGTAPAITATSQRFGRRSEEHGQTIPAVTTPHGMNLWTPQTRDTEHKCIAPYYWGDSLLQGIRCSHWINGGCTQDYGSFTIMPLAGQLITDPVDRATPFFHQSETATPSLYSVALPQLDIKAEVTSTKRSGIIRLTYNYDGDAYIVINPNSDESQGSIRIDPATATVTGSNPVHRIYQGKGQPAGFAGNFVVQADRTPSDWGVYSDTLRLDGLTQISYAPAIGAWLKFKVSKGDTICLRSANSFVNIPNAIANLKTEIPTWDFDSIQSALQNTWDKYLSRIEVTGGTDDERAKFYGSLWRASLLPRIVSDTDGSHMAFGGSGDIIKLPQGREYYDDFSMWDTYRALHPLLNIISPSESAQMMQSLVDKAQQGGWFPIFPCWNSYTAAMIGDHCASVIADAYTKGITDFDAQKAYTYLYKNATQTPDTLLYRDGMGRRALDSYMNHGFIPLQDTVPYAYHKREQVSRTIEYAYDDHALAILAHMLGHDLHAQDLEARSYNFLNVIDPMTGWARGRNSDRTWAPDTLSSPFAFSRYITEGMPCHYTFTQFHLDSLAQAVGGRHNLTAMLDTLFDGNWYWHGNEPCHHIPWLTSMLGDQNTTARRVRHIMQTEYLNHPGGLSGNDDAGQMSAWYVFAAMGFYPVTPGEDTYALGIPAFDRIVINLENGRQFTIITPDAPQPHPSVSTNLLDGVPLNQPILHHTDIISGKTLQIDLEPNRMSER